MPGYFDDYFNYFDGRTTGQLKAVINEIVMYFKDGRIGGWSSFYCKVTWNDSTLKNDADLEIFNLLFKIDIRNGADTSKIVFYLCHDGGYEAIKVRF